MTRTELITALEAAEGPSRELDRDIHIAIGNEPPESPHRPSGSQFWFECPHYTESIDAALSFTPEGWVWDIASTGACWIMKDDDLNSQIVIGGVSLPAIALCIANLRALEAQEKP